MNWLKENPFIAGVTVVTIAGVAILMYFVSQSMTKYQEAADAYSSAVQKLHGLQNRTPFPSEENFEKSRALEEKYNAQLSTLRAALSKMQRPIPPDITPQRFQDDLRTAVNEITGKATSSGVALPPDFYLGFSQYANNLPNEKAAPLLARQLGILKDIIMRLIDFKVKSIDSLDRTPLPEESGAAAPREAARQQRGTQQRGARAQPEAAPARGLERMPIDLAFTAEQGKFRVAFNSFLNSEQFLIIRSLSLQNTSPAGPPVAQRAPAGPGSAPADQPAGGASGENPAASLNVILGRELVKATLRIEIVDFPKVEETTK